jgi:hypothetical protein
MFSQTGVRNAVRKPTPPALRQTVLSEPVTGANVRIRLGAFGVGTPVSGSEAVMGAGVFDGLYSYHEGDLFTPGAQNWVFQPNFELPFVTWWGQAFLRTPNTFNPLQNPQLYASQNVVNNGIGGLQAGTIEFEPLLYDGA